MDSIRANSHAVFETVFDICYKAELRQEMDYIRANSHAVFETRFDICYKPELDKKWILFWFVTDIKSGFKYCMIASPDRIHFLSSSGL
jgi:hypothetical protein